MSEYHEDISAARAHLAGGRARDAYVALRPLLEYPGAFQGDAQFREAFVLFAEVARHIAGDELAQLVAAVGANPDHPSVLYDAAYLLYEQQLFPIAATLLDRANRIAPGQATIVHELSSCLEAMRAYSVAARVIELSGLPETDPTSAYLHAFNAFMCGDLDVSRRRLPALRALESPQYRFFADALAGLLARADAVGVATDLSDEHALTGWHAAINGCVLLHESPHGWEHSMRGRYAYVGDGPGLMREGLERLRAVLDAAQRDVGRVVAAPDRASRILGRAAARLFERPYVEWEAGAEQDGLVVAWDLDRVGDADFLGALRSHAPKQVLFAHASSWVDVFPYTPDVTTLLHQTITHPWTGGGMRIDPETRAVSTAPPDERDDEVLAESILEAEIHDPSRSGLDLVLEVTRAMAAISEPHSGGVFRRSGERARQRAGSPVLSNLFTS